MNKMSKVKCSGNHGKDGKNIEAQGKKRRLKDLAGKSLVRAICAILIAALFCASPMPVWATNTAKVEKEKKEAQKKAETAKQAAKAAEEKKKAAQAKMDKLQSQLTNLLSVIQVLENDMASKEAEIAQAQKDYEAAKLQEDKQYQAMKKRIKYMYEKGDTEYLDILLQVKSMSDMLNKAEYVKDIYAYDRRMLLKYKDTKDQVANLQNQLEDDKDEMEMMEEDYKSQQANLEAMIASQRKEVVNFDSQLAKAKKDAAAYAKVAEEKTAQLRKAREEEAKRQAAAEAARKKALEEARRASPGKLASANEQYTGPAAVRSSGGTAKGRAIADYALRFVGNPYVYGGTSLTNGADCSGFIQSVYAHFGISLPRTSSEQGASGVGVGFNDMQPGDLVHYAGHIAIYIGNGQIVHASTARTGIKVSPVAYRTILGIRRII